MQDFQYISNKPKVEILNKTIDGHPFDISNYVRRMTDRDDLDSASCFEIELVATPIDESSPRFTAGNILAFFMKTIKKNDIISMGVHKAGGWNVSKIDTVTRSKMVSASGFERRIVITGRNFQSLLIDDDIVFSPNLATDKRTIKLLGKQRAEFLGMLRGLGEEGVNQFIDRPILEVILWIMVNMPSISLNTIYADYSAEGQILNSKTDKIGKYFIFDLKQYKGDLVFEPNLAMYSGKVYNYLMQAVDRMFYEVFVDTKPDEKGVPRPCLFVRPKPWDVLADFPNEPIEILAPQLSDFTYTGVKDDPAITPTTNPEDLAQIQIRMREDLKTNLWLWDQQGPEQVVIETKKTTRSDYNLYTTMLSTPESYKDFHVITDDMGIYDDSIMSSTMDIINFITMTPTKDLLANTALAQYGYLFPLISCDSVKRFGIRAFQGETNLFQREDLIPPGDPRNNEIIKPGDDYLVYGVGIGYARRRDQLWNWYKYNEIMVSSSKRIMGDDDYRKGDKFYFPDELTEEGDKGVFYYCKGLTRECIQTQGGSIYQVSLNLVRGQNTAFKKRYDKARNEADTTIRINLGAIRESAGEKEEEKNNTPYVNLVQGMVDVITNGFNRNKSNYQYFMDLYANNKELSFKMDAKSLAQLISDQAKKYAVDANMMVSLINHESAFNPKAISRSGCSGLGQFSKPTAGDVLLWNQYQMTAGQEDHANYNDIRFHPDLSVRSIAYALKHLKNWGSSLESKVIAICSYGNNKQRSYYSTSKVLSDLSTYCPGHELLSEEAKNIASAFYTRQKA
jgi:hypothetical protein